MSYETPSVAAPLLSEAHYILTVPQKTAIPVSQMRKLGFRDHVSLCLGDTAEDGRHCMGHICVSRAHTLSTGLIFYWNIPYVLWWWDHVCVK